MERINTANWEQRRAARRAAEQAKKENRARRLAALVESREIEKADKEDWRFIATVGWYMAGLFLLVIVVLSTIIGNLV